MRTWILAYTPHIVETMADQIENWLWLAATPNTDIGYAFVEHLNAMIRDLNVSGKVKPYGEPQASWLEWRKGINVFARLDPTPLYNTPNRNDPAKKADGAPRTVAKDTQMVLWLDPLVSGWLCVYRSYEDPRWPTTTPGWRAVELWTHAEDVK